MEIGNGFNLISMIAVYERDRRAPIEATSYNKTRRASIYENVVSFTSTISTAFFLKADNGLVYLVGIDTEGLLYVAQTPTIFTGLDYIPLLCDNGSVYKLGLEVVWDGSIQIYVEQDLTNETPINSPSLNNPSISNKLLKLVKSGDNILYELS